MTSANVTQYRIERSIDGQLVTVGNHYQSHLCKTRWEELLKFTPLEDHLITPYGLDEEEEEWEGNTMSLLDFLVRCNPCPILGVPRIRHGLIYRRPEEGAGWEFHELFAETPEALDGVAGHFELHGAKTKRIRMSIFVSSVKTRDEILAEDETLAEEHDEECDEEE
jgi:hypothetical protein